MRASEIESLTWLRGLAAGVVVVSHSVRALEVGYNPQDEIPGFNILNAFDLGSLGVALFFVLSGCTLTLSNYRLQVGSGRELTGFYFKRFFRIWPAYVVALAAYLAFRPVFQMLYGQPLGHWVEHQFFAPSDFNDLLIYLGLTFNITGPSGLYNNAFWSLPVEFQYYLMFPLFLLSIRFTSIFGPAIIAAGMFFLARFDVLPLDSKLVLVLAFTFAAGMALGHLYSTRKLRLNRAFALVMVVVIVALASLMANNIVRIEFYRIIPSEWVFFGLCAVALVTLILFSDLRLPGFARSPALYLGKISYSLYLYHNLLIAIAILGLIHFGIHSEWARIAWICSWAFAGSIGLAALSYRWIESPGTRLGKKFAQMLMPATKPGKEPT
ncbi:acyltransferase family protein [Marinobacter sp. OP 3.4]|uniref:acyltransferase family protein n=1 Tax=Marinobacter sp. OP 3.4 TaxID=3076501 RepID=UPI002E1D8037